jgi:hypothetical protein
MKAISLDLDAYGTLIPDLRTLAYRVPDVLEESSLSVAQLVKLDSFLCGAQMASVPPSSSGVIEVLYRALPKDDFLEDLLKEICSNGGTVSLFIGSSAGACPTWDKILDGYSQRMPPCVEVGRGGVPDRTSRQGASIPIFVSRSVPRVERMLKRQKQAIHYESAYRLRRELELRGHYIGSDHDE